MAIEYSDSAADEGRYFDWVAAHPDGFMVNTIRPKPSTKYLVLHLGRCGTIGDLKGAGTIFTGRPLPPPRLRHPSLAETTPQNVRRVRTR